MSFVPVASEATLTQFLEPALVLSSQLAPPSVEVHILPPVVAQTTIFWPFVDDATLVKALVEGYVANGFLKVYWIFPIGFVSKPTV